MKQLHLVRTIFLAGGLLLQLSALCVYSRGAPGDVDLSFDPGSGVNGPVTAVALQPDGKVIIGGGFTTVKGLARSGIARLNADGSGDPTFGPNSGVPYNVSYVSSLAVQADGKVLIGGGNGIDRRNADGSLDNSFNPVVTGNFGVPWIYSIVLQSDGKVLIGGNFTKVNATNRNGIARLNASGSLDSSFNPGTGVSGGYVGVFALALQPDGKVVVGGEFFSVNGTFRNNIARLNANGSVDSSFNPGNGANDSVRSTALQADGKVLIGGHFTTVNGTNRNGIARLNVNGSVDSSFNPGTGVYPGYPGGVMSFVVQADGKVLIGGAFTTVNGTNRNGIVRLNANGSLDNSFNPDFDHEVSSVAMQPDGKALVGGSFSSINGTNRNNIARLNANGSVDSSFDPGAGLDSSISSLVVQPNGKVLIGGVYTFINGTNRYGSQLNADGSRDSTFISSSFNPWTSVFAPDFGYVGPMSLLVQSDGKVLIGGYIDYATQIDEYEWADSYAPFVARFNADGSLDGSFNSPVLTGNYPGVCSLAVQAEGKVLIGGQFAVNGTNSSNIVRLNADGSLDSNFNLGTVAYGNVNSIVVQSDGKVLIGGDLIYNYINDTNYNSGIARLNANGSLDSTFNPGRGIGVDSIAVQSGCKILIGGDFTTVNGTSRNHIARLNANGSLDSSFNPGTGADGRVRSIALQSDGKVLIGGDFTIVGGAVRPRVARLYGNSIAPSLNIARSDASMILSWPETGLNFQLQESTDLSLPNSWSPVAQPALTNAGQISVTVPTSVGGKFFRLKSQ